ncbi:uncharacterized protein si:ch211-158d24.4 isoform X1 [Pygocentrus nattereri]|uniref:uncharacterized protein si:ch211-158d24.4 isoform X1 n=1 Tax=Pygocentrus nattereri TaxID=42514 RepID=UPI0008146942|nr:uncharacterized protein si:ch211-158d24.4 isoform X1 [Pygocentrus nattereri]
MGVWLSRMAPMELRREDPVRAEIYNMLLESDAFVHSHRALRRELCITRMASVILALLLCSSFCLLFFIQLHRPACNEKGQIAKANAELPLRVGAHVAAREPNPEKPPSASLHILCPVMSPDSLKTGYNSEGYIKWAIKPEPFGFSLGTNNESLVIPQDGTYRISVQVTYRGREDVSCEEQIVLVNELQRSTQAYDVAITALELYETIYCSSFTWRKSMYSEGVLYLGKGDMLKLHSNNRSLLDCGGNVGLKTFLTVHYELTG